MKWSKGAVARSRKDGRDTGYQVIRELSGSGKSFLDLGDWWSIRPSAWLQEAVTEDHSINELEELDLYWLSGLNSVLTTVGLKAIISGKWNDGRLIVTRVLGKASNETQT